ncbi:MAG: oligosaccharide flippase family protein [Chloroflexota bacterium]
MIRVSVFFLENIKNLFFGADKVGLNQDEIDSALFRSKFHTDLAQKVTQTYIIQLLTILLGIITSVVVARVLGPSGKGIYAVAITLGSLGVQFGNLGLHTANAYYGARDHKWLSGLVGNSLLVSFGLGSGLAVLLGLFFKFNSNLAPVGGYLLILALLWIPFGLAYILLRNLLLGIQDIWAFNCIDLVNKLLVLISTMLIILSKKANVEIVFLIVLAGLVLGCIFTYLRLQYKMGCPPTLSLSIFKKQSIYGLKIYVSSFFNDMLVRGDILIVNYFLMRDQVGYYSVASAMAGLVYIFTPVVCSILNSKLSPMDDPNEKWKINKTVVLMVGIFISILVVFAWLFAKPCLLLLYGNSYLPALEPFLWLLPGIFFLSLGMTTGVIFGASGMPVYAISPFLFAGITNIFLNIFIVPKYGIIGAAFVSDVTYFMFFIMMVFLVQYFLKKNRLQVAS